MSSTTSSSPRVFRRADYKPLPIAVSSIRLNFLLGETTVVESTIQLTLAQNHTVQDLCDQGGLFLDGRGDVKLQNIRVGGKNLESGSDYVLSEHHLHLKPTDGLLHQFATATAENPLQIETTVHICPKNNSLLEGLYQSGGNYCTQCEAEGFRGITFFFDRPDILTRYTTRIEASKTLCPVLLSNGNLVEEGVLPSTNTEEPRHYVVWEDPFPKPSYLFALVAGQLVFREDTFRTCSGKDVRLRIYVQAQNIHRVDHAMNSLKRAMRWDEEKFGREYDLACFNIVAVDDFNMGAMENKSLNIFNSRAVLATSATATDAEFQRIEGIVAHEYFHNWTGNRVTCRDWFQLTLKEGLTVYRDQEFSSDMNCRDVYRLGVVSMVRSLQFPQDRGPMAHPIRPDVYEKIDNFYTITVYRKGAEIIRIYETILGRAGFRKGMDLYFERHDGQAVTCDNFRAAMEDANGVDLGVLGNWYSQAGTPQVKLRSVLNTDTKTYTLEVTQHTPSTAGEPEKRPVLIPIRMALLNAADGKPIPLRIHPSPRGLECPQVTPSTAPVTELVLPLSEMRQVFVFDGVDADACVLSAMRGFSAPVEYSIEGESPETWRFLLEKDTDGFVRYESSQRLAMHSIVQIYQHFCTRRSCNQVDMVHDVTTFEIDNPMVCELLAAYRSILTDRSTNLHLVAHLLSFPSNAELMAQIPRCQPPILYAAKNALRRTLSKALSKEYQALLAELEASSPPLEQAYVYNSEHVARRALLNTVLSHLAMSPTAAEEMYPKLLERQRNATNMTDELGAVQILNQCCDPAPRKKSLDDFYKKWSVDPLVLLNWMSLHAVAEVSHNISTIQSIMASPDFHIKNPNCCYALISAFASSLVNFHAADGSGYAFMADCVLEIDTVNHQVAAKTVACFNIHKQLDEAREQMILTQLKRLAGIPGLSANVREVISKSIQSAAEIKSA